jgi:hypothetical protein
MKNTMKPGMFNDFSQAVLKASLQEAFAIKPVAHSLFGLLSAWGSYAIITSGVFGPVSELPAWITSSATLGVMGIGTFLSLLMMSTKSLLPAVAIWAIGIALVFVNPSHAVWVFMSAVASATMFRMFPTRSSTGHADPHG